MSSEPFYSAVQRTCGTCAHWQRQVLSSYSIKSENGSLETICGIQQRGHDRRLNPDYMRGSDRCAKWSPMR